MLNGVSKGRIYMALITINGVSLDPSTDAQALNLAGLESADASASDYILIQTIAPLSSDQTDELARLGGVVLEYVSENTYLCSYKGTDLTSIRSLPFVTWANVYLRGFKVAPNLRPAGMTPAAHILPTPAALSHSRTPRTVDIVFHEDADTGSDALRTAVSAAARGDKDTLPMGRRKVRLTVEEKHLDDLAAIDAVRVIQEVPEVKLDNNVARSILNANVVVNGTTYQGDGQVVAVADSGFDNGSTTSPHPAFTGRVARLYGIGRATQSDDPHGHGTHVCGSVLGDGTSASMGGAIQGTAPRAQLVVQSLINSAGEPVGGVPADLTDLFEPPYRDDGARVHTNSWGAIDPSLAYDQGATEIDDFVWNHPDLVICRSAGNHGTDGNGNGVVDPAQVGSFAAAKNCITVGASESVRREIAPDIPTYGILNSVGFPSFPIHDDPMANHEEGMAAFSDRGPTQEGRFKPDVVAPGTSILSTHSRNAPDEPNDFGTSSDPDYFFTSGTSMATPLVAGCAAVLRETLVKNGMPTPSASLIKALLINGAVELTGQYSPSEAGPSPNNNSGFGRVNLLGSVILPGPNPDAGFGDGGPLRQGEEDTFTVEIPRESPGNDSVANAVPTGVGTSSLGATFKITLVWTDPPGANLQNDLDLIVRAADGSERHGNMGISNGFDRVNNVEQVLWSSMPPGEAQVTIRATRITRFPQPYAYAWRIS
jgi:serine protease AprX